MKKFIFIFTLFCMLMQVSVYAEELTQADIDRLNEEKRIAALAEIERVQEAAKIKAENEMAAAQATAMAHAENVQKQIDAYEDWVDEQEELAYGDSDNADEDENTLTALDVSEDNVEEAALVEDSAIAEVVVDEVLAQETDVIVVEPSEAKQTVDTVASNNTFGILDDDYNNLCRIVEAEGLNSGLVGKVMIANVILNRVKSPLFDNTITSVIKAPGQFSPARTGRMYKVIVTPETIDAVNRALSGENPAGSALYFKSTKRGNTFLGRKA